MFEYDKLVLRNKGYISEDLQGRLSEISVLVAGCGVGSYIAEAAVRLGVRNITLLDGDKVELHNLNRQSFIFEDVGEYKTLGLSKRLRAINPDIELNIISEYLSADNASEIAQGHDLIFDTIDFLDLKAIVALHDQAEKYNIPLASSISAGWGAACLFFPYNGRGPSFRKIFGLPESGFHLPGYTDAFKVFMSKIVDVLPADVTSAMQAALGVMADGKPCPAPHVSVGSFSVAALANTVLTRYFGQKEVSVAPEMIIYDLGEISCQQTILLK